MRFFLAQIKQNRKLTKTKFDYLPKEIINFLILTLTLLFTLSLVSYDSSDPNFFKTGLNDVVKNYIGISGAYISHISFMVFGSQSYFLAIFFIYLTIRKYFNFYIYSSRLNFKSILIVTIMIISLSVLLEYSEGSTGGLVGMYSYYYLSNYIGSFGSIVSSLLFFMYTFVIYFNIPISNIINKSIKITSYVYLKLKYQILSLYQQTNLQIEKSKQKKLNINKGSNEKINNASIEIVEPKKTESKRAFKEKQQNLFSDKSRNQLPLIEFLEKHDSEITNHDEASLKLMSEMLEQNLSHYGISAEVKAVKPGPIVTLFEIEPAVGTKASSINNISKDLARTMTVPSLRVVESVPGTAHIGIEIPNDDRETVSLKDIICSKEYENSKAALTMALGKDIQGKPICTDLHKLPHLLVAGTTGSGKSVAVHSMIISLLYKYSIDHLRFLMIDPKMLELSTYESIPHLLHPVVTDMNEAKSVLHWCVQEMERRYRYMMDLNVRNIQSYNKLVKENNNKGIKSAYSPTEGNNERYHENLPYIVVVVDEFADMMQTVGKKSRISSLGLLKRHVQLEFT